MGTKILRKVALFSTTALMTANMAYAQDAATVATEEAEASIVVTGSRIQGAQINDVLPVTVLDEQQIENTGASSGDELFRALPQNGTIAFNEQNATTQNNVRGDVGSVNLRDLGTGNTLLLINGRRMNLHPGFQTELLVPVVSPDTNEIAPGSVRRIEVLRDGASAIYGADAVAGVINTVLKGNLKGGFLEGDWRASDGTSLYSYSISGGLGFDFGGGRGNLTVYGGRFHENGLGSSGREYSRDDDRTRLLVGTDFEGEASFNNRNTFGPFGQFDIQTSPNSRTPINDDDFYLQPSTFTGCRMDFLNGICARNGETPTTAVRYNTIFGNSLISRKDRYNAMALLNYELTDSVEAYFEGSYYRSENQRFNDASAILSAVPVGIARTAYWNPFGPTTLVGGGANPNRLPGTTIPTTGADVIMERYRFVDGGNRSVLVDKDAYRLVAGLRGNFGAWDFDTGFVYSESKLTDLETNRVSLTAMQQSINRTTPDAYNPFNGGCLNDPGQGDCTPNPTAVFDTFRINVSRKGGTSLALADFKVSRDDLKREIGGLAARHLQESDIQMPAQAFQTLIEELLNEVLGLGPLEPLLADPMISDILINGVDNVYVERNGLLERSSTRFRDERHLLRIIDKIVSSVGRRIDESQPWVDARLEDGSRVNAIIRPCAIDGPSLSIRKFSKTPLSMDRLLEAGALSAPAAEFLRAAVKGRLNSLISGGTGSGKTTMLNAMSAFIDPRHRMVTIEDAAELQLQQDHVVRLETRPANTEGQGRITQRDLIINALRMRPDRIMIGEVRGAEAFDMLQAMNTGHDGSMTTLHANTPRDALSRIEQMIGMSGIDRFSVTCAAYLGGLATLVLVGLSFENLSSGLANSSSDGPFFCRTLESSGGDDDAVVFVFVLFALPFLARLCRLKHKAGKSEIILFSSCILLVCVALTLGSIDCASIIYTAFIVPDIMLAVALLAMPLCAWLLVRLCAGR